MTKCEDNLICSLCKGTKVIKTLNEVTSKHETVLCPRCKGNGILIDEKKDDNRKILLG